MKSRLIFLLLGLFLFNVSGIQAQWGKSINGEGEVVTKQLRIASFDKLSLTISGNLIITQGSSQSVKVEAQANIIDNIKTDVSNGRWKIAFRQNARNYKTVTVYVTVPNLKALNLSGSGSAKSTGTIKADDFDLSISGSGDVELSLDASNLDTSISGSGDITLNGSAKSLDIAISGSGDVDAMGLKTQDCDVSVSGSGDSRVNVSSNLNVSVSGSGDVTYKGEPNIKSSVSGSGDVESE